MSDLYRRRQGTNLTCLNCGMTATDCTDRNDEIDGPYCCHECDHTAWLPVTIDYEAAEDAFATVPTSGRTIVDAALGGTE